jgi:DNA gyrase inhibitor GyrI
MSARLTVEAGIPVSGDVRVEAPVFVETLPGGRYVTVAHVGHPDELVAVTEELLVWAQHQGLIWDMTPTPEGEEWGCRLEILMTSPAEEPDIHKWETVLMIKLAD